MPSANIVSKRQALQLRLWQFDPPPAAIPSSSVAELAPPWLPVSRSWSFGIRRSPARFWDFTWWGPGGATRSVSLLLLFSFPLHPLCWRSIPIKSRVSRWFFTASPGFSSPTLTFGVVPAANAAANACVIPCLVWSCCRSCYRSIIRCWFVIEVSKSKGRESKEEITKTLRWAAMRKARRAP